MVRIYENRGPEPVTSSPASPTLSGPTIQTFDSSVIVFFAFDSTPVGTGYFPFDSTLKAGKMSEIHVKL